MQRSTRISKVAEEPPSNVPSVVDLVSVEVGRHEQEVTSLSFAIDGEDHSSDDHDGDKHFDRDFDREYDRDHNKDNDPAINARSHHTNRIYEGISTHNPSHHATLMNHDASFTINKRQRKTEKRTTPLATCSRDGSVRVWSVDAENGLGRLQGKLVYGRPIRACVFTGGVRDRSTHPPLGSHSRDPQSHSRDPASHSTLDESPGGLLAAISGTMFLVWDATLGELVTEQDLGHGALLTLSLAADRSHVLVGTASGLLLVYALPTGALCMTAPQPPLKSPIRAAHLSCDATVLAAAAPSQGLLLLLHMTPDVNLDFEADLLNDTHNHGDSAAVLGLSRFSVDALLGCVLTPDASLLAAHFADGSITLWSLSPQSITPVSDPASNAKYKVTANPIHGPDIDEIATSKQSVHLHTVPATCVAFSPDKKMVAVGFFDGSAVILDVGTLCPLAVMAPPRSLSLAALTTLAFTPSMAAITTASRDGIIRMWRLPKTLLNRRPSTSPTTKATPAPALSPTPLRRSPVAIPPVPASTPALGPIIPLPRQFATSATHNGDHPVMSNRKSSPSIIHSRPLSTPILTNRSSPITAAPNQPPSTPVSIGKAPQKPSMVIRAVAVSPKGDGICVQTTAKKALLVSGPDRASTKETHPHNAALSHVVYSPSGESFATAAMDGFLLTFRHDGTPILNVMAHDAGISLVTYARTESKIATAGYDGVIKIWDTETGSLIQQLNLEGKWARYMEFSPIADGFLAVTFDGVVHIWELEEGSKFQILSGPVPFLTAQFCMDAYRVVCTTQSPTLYLIEVVSANLIAQLSAHKDLVSFCALDNEGAKFATASRDGTICVWDASSAKCISTFTGHRKIVTRCAFSADSRYIAASSEDGTVRVWDITSGLLKNTLDCLDEPIQYCSFMLNTYSIFVGTETRVFGHWNFLKDTEFHHFATIGDSQVQSQDPFAWNATWYRALCDHYYAKKEIDTFWLLRHSPTEEKEFLEGLAQLEESFPREHKSAFANTSGKAPVYIQKPFADRKAQLEQQLQLLRKQLETVQEEYELLLRQESQSLTQREPHSDQEDGSASFAVDLKQKMQSAKNATKALLDKVQDPNLDLWTPIDFIKLAEILEVKLPINIHIKLSDKSLVWHHVDLQEVAENLEIHAFGDVFRTMMALQDILQSRGVELITQLLDLKSEPLNNPVDPYTWTHEYVADWISKLGFADLAETFKRERVMGRDLLGLGSSHLEHSLGITGPSTRQRVLEHIQTLRIENGLAE